MSSRPASRFRSVCSAGKSAGLGLCTGRRKVYKWNRTSERSIFRVGFAEKCRRDRNLFDSNGDAPFGRILGSTLISISGAEGCSRRAVFLQIWHYAQTIDGAVSFGKFNIGRRFSASTWIKTMIVIGVVAAAMIQEIVQFPLWVVTLVVLPAHRIFRRNRTMNYQIVLDVSVYIAQGCTEKLDKES